MINHLVDHTFVEFGGSIWQQSIGLPLGTQCAGQLANTYCFTYEFQFLRRLIQAGKRDFAKNPLDTTKLTLAQTFLNCRRYIDDLFVLDIKEFDDYLYIPQSGPNGSTNGHGIYPQNILTLIKADSGLSVPYLDIFIHQNKRRGLIAGIFDKRLDSKYDHINVIRYPDINSFLATKSKSSILTGQLHRFSRICTNSRDFVYQSAFCIYRMLTKGYPHSWIWPRARRFLIEHSNIYGNKPVYLWIARITRKLGELVNGHIKAGPFGQIRLL
jgi:hypothetical protein